MPLSDKKKAAKAPTHFDPLPKWEGADVFLIGGGPSLKTFDWSQLHGHKTIGCNDAFRLGSEVCQVCVFGDRTFWTANRKELGEFKGWVVTNVAVLNPPMWLKTFQRLDEGLCVRGEVAVGNSALAWNNNTGALAINLALHMGARRVFLLGYDCTNPEGKTHWHDRTGPLHQDAETYAKFKGGFATIAAHLAGFETPGRDGSTVSVPPKYPGVSVFNVTDGASRLHTFERVSFESVGLRGGR